MEKFLKLPKEDRLAIIEEAANRLGVTPTIIEKDFWVCWTLKHLYLIDEIAPYLTFKGGTSLSKAYKLIERFSEDCYITICKSIPEFSSLKNPSDQTISGKEKARRIDSLIEKSINLVSEKILPLLREELSISLGNEVWNLELDNSDPQTILFHFPHIHNYEGYIKPTIRLEFGARADTSPIEKKEIKPYIADEFPDFFEAPISIMPTLSAERTFWEKVTILHSIYHSNKLGERISRHYYDTYIMPTCPNADKFIQNTDLLEKVVANKSLYFKQPSASYETAKIGSLKLVPDKDLLKRLTADFKEMEEMFMSNNIPTFDKIILGIAELEKKINMGSSN